MSEDAIDLKYAKQAADYIGSEHTEVYMTVDEVVSSLETVIRLLGTYDITTIRASIGMYLVCKAIHERTDIRVVLTGEISDELFGYKYTDFAPDADVLDNGKGQVIGDRSFGDDPERVTQMAAAVSEGLHSQGVLSTFKHFPGHGAASGDTHEGFAYTDKSYGELLERELKPFMAAGERGVDAVMAAHISLPGVTGDNTPCTMSRQMLTEVLRGDLGYEGLIVTDALNMGAITKNYTSAEAAVGALEAGADLLLMPQDFHQAAEGVLGAVLEGKISQERIDQSVRRIIRAKLQWSVMEQ